MNNKWLAAQGLQYVQDVISAINTLALNIKLEQAGIERDEAETSAARAELEAFLDEMAKVVHRIEGQRHRPVLGVELYLRHLAESLIEAPVSHYRGKVHTHPAELKASLEAADPTEKEQLVGDLQALRRILEEQIQDNTQPLGAL